MIGTLTLAVMAALGIWWAFRAKAPRSTPASPAFGAPEVAWQEGVRLGTAGQFRESLERFEYAAPKVRGRDWIFHHDFSSTLNNVTMQVDDVDGIPVPAVRTSIQRVRLVRRSLEEISLAERLAKSDQQRSVVHRARGQTYQVWGFPWEALGDLQTARHLDPSNAGFTYSADAYLYRMQHPVRSGPSRDEENRGRLDTVPGHED